MSIGGTMPMTPHDRLDAVSQHRAELVRCAARWLGYRADAEDAVTETFIRYAVASRDAAEDEQDDKRNLAFMKGILYNVCRELRRKRTVPADVLAELHNARVEPTDPYEIAADRDEGRYAARQAERLPKSARVVADVWMGGGNTREAAQRLGQSLYAAERIATDARKRLRRMMGAPVIVVGWLRLVRRRLPHPLLVTSTAVALAVATTGLAMVRLPSSGTHNERLLAPHRPAPANDLSSGRLDLDTAGHPVKTPEPGVSPPSRPPDEPHSIRLRGPEVDRGRDRTHESSPPLPQP